MWPGESGTMSDMPGLFDGTPLERPVTCDLCHEPLDACRCPRDAEGNIVRPQDQRVRVSREKRRGKWVTVIIGLDPVANDLGAMLAALKSTLATGGTIREDRIEVQGDHRERVMAVLSEKGFRPKISGG